MRTPAQYSRHLVTVRGVVLGQDTQHLLIMWPECQFGMRLTMPKDLEGKPQIAASYRAVKRGNPGTTDRDITREFVGTFHYSAVGSVYELVVADVRPTEAYKNLK